MLRSRQPALSVSVHLMAVGGKKWGGGGGEAADRQAEAQPQPPSCPGPGSGIGTPLPASLRLRNLRAAGEIAISRNTRGVRQA